MNMKINQFSIRNTTSNNNSGDSDYDMHPGFPILEALLRKYSQAPNRMSGNNNNNNDSNYAAHLLLEGLERLATVLKKLGKLNQDGSIPEVQGKGKGGSYGSHQDSNDKSHDNAQHSKNHHTSNSKDGYGDDRIGADENDKPSKTSGPSSMPDPKGVVTVNKPIVVKAGQTFDGGGKLYKAGPALGDGGQGEHQKPVFIIEPGGKLQNVQYQGADGIHTMGDATIKNVWNRDVGEDAMTMKKPGHVTWSGGGAFNATDKIFQLNAGGSFTLENFTADNFGTGIRTNGGKNIDTDIVVRNSHFTNGKQIVRTDAPAATITLDDLTFSNVKYDVLAPDETKVVGAVKRSYKPYKG